MTPKKILLLVFAAFIAIGCSDDSTTVDSSPMYSHILLTDMELSAYVVDTDTLNVKAGQDKSADDPVTIPIRISIKVSEPLGQGGAVSTLRYEIRLDGKSSVLQSGDLHASSTPLTWEADIAFDRKRGDVGDYRVDVFGTDEWGTALNTGLSKFRLIYGSIAPVIIAVTAPDTLDLQIQTVVFSMTAEVTDQSGLADIKQVYFNSFLPNGRPSTSNPNIMYDDGLALHGDVTAGDGIYTLKLQMPPTTLKGEYRFEFRALDFSSLSSNVVIHKLIVR
ncbi:MAG: choice-of-anchor X domain-containing protein [Bacteroidota bacterium]